MTVQIIIGDCRKVLDTLLNQSVHCIVTSPPFWGLRDYGLPPLVWGGDAECVHVWGPEIPGDSRGGSGPAAKECYGGNDGKTTYARQVARGNWCQHCGAWRGSLGLEPTAELYVEHLVGIFRQVRRVLRDDGVVFLNLGDSYSSGSILANVNDLLAERIKKGIIFLSPGCSLTITTKGDSILKENELPPEDVFLRFLGVQRVSVKQGDNDFRQIFDGFAPIANCWVSPSVVASVSKANAELILDPQDGISIIISDHNLDSNPALSISIAAGATENGQAPFTIKETRKPMPEGIRNIQTTGQPISLDPSSKSLAQVNLIDKPIALADTFMPRSKCLGNFCVTEASPKHFALSLMDRRVEVTCCAVGHLFVSNSLGSLVRYAELYQQAKQLSNERQAKQQLGIPDMVKRALMRDGWLCRSTIIWEKPNCMPESVRDRPTCSHEYLFLLAKEARYYYDADAIRMPNQSGPSDIKKMVEQMARIGGKHKILVDPFSKASEATNIGRKRAVGDPTTGRNKRTVWTIATPTFKLRDDLTDDERSYVVSELLRRGIL